MWLGQPLFLLLLLLVVVYQMSPLKGQRLSYDNPKCIVDPSLPPEANDNYMDCSAPAMVEMGKTECCTIENETGCCMPNQNSTKMQEIGIYLGAVTAALAAMCIYCFWCRKNQSVVKVQQFVASKFHRLQETCKCISCCRRQVESRRRLEALKEAAREVPALQLPSEASAQDPTFDTFWNGQMVKST